MHKYELTVVKDGPLLRALGLGLPLLPGAAIRDALKRRDIRVNDARVDSNVKVKPGDRVVLFTPVPMKDIPVLFEDGDCLVASKPAGVNSDENTHSAFSMLSWARSRAGGGAETALVHRLDNQTSGLMVIAKTARAEALLTQAFKQGQVHKQYACLVKGSPRPAGATLNAWLCKDAQAGKVVIQDTETSGGKRITTGYETLEAGDVSRLLVTLHTGRTHQIRAHLAYLGHPVLGDEVYGDRAFNRLRNARALKLCAVRLGFDKACALESLAGRVFEIATPF